MPMGIETRRTGSRWGLCPAVAIDGECRWALKRKRAEPLGRGRRRRNRRRMPMGIETNMVACALIAQSKVAIDGECRWALKHGDQQPFGRPSHGRNRRRMPMGIETWWVRSRSRAYSESQSTENADGH